MAGAQIFNYFINFYSTQLHLEQGKRDICNDAANLFLYSVQVLVGQRVVSQKGENFIAGAVWQTPWYQTAIKVTLFIAFYRITVPLLTVTTVIGTIARLVSCRSPEIRQGIFSSEEERRFDEATAGSISDDPSFDPEKILDEAFLQFSQTTHATNPLQAFIQSSVSQIHILGPAVQTLVKMADFAPMGMSMVQRVVRKFCAHTWGKSVTQVIQEQNQFLEMLLMQNETSLEPWLKQETARGDRVVSIRTNFQLYTSRHAFILMSTSFLGCQDLVQKFIKNYKECFSKLQTLGLLNYWNAFPEYRISSATEKLAKHIRFFEEFLQLAENQPKAEVSAWLESQYLSYQPHLPFARADLFYDIHPHVPMPYLAILRQQLELQHSSLLTKHQQLWEKSKRKLQQLKLDNISIVQVHIFRVIKLLSQSAFSDIF
jgi:hypothetical protein